MIEFFFPTRAVANSRPFQEAITIVRLQAPLSDRSHRDRVIEEVRDALDGLSGVTLTGMSVVGHDTERLIRRDLSRLLGVAAILVAGWLLLYFRSFVHAMLAFLPAAFGLVSLLEHFPLMCSGVSASGEESVAVVGRDRVHGVAHSRDELTMRSGGSPTKMLFDFRPHGFDGVEVRRIGWQVANRGAGRLDCLLYPKRLVG